MCHCHERPMTGGCTLGGLPNQDNKEEEGLEYASKHSYMTLPTAPLELEDIIVQDTL